MSNEVLTLQMLIAFFTFATALLAHFPIKHAASRARRRQAT